MKDTDIYRLAHDIKSPINQVNGLLELALRENNPIELKRILIMAQSANSKMYGVVDQILHAAEDAYEMVEPGGIIKSIWHEMKDFPGFGKMNFVYQNGMDVSFQAKPKLLASVFQNIMENAIKYRKPESDKSYLMVLASRGTDCVFIRFSDNGIGIRKEVIQKIFEPGFHNPNTKDSHGMGLFLVKKHMKAMGGQISVKSRSKAGTTFTLKFPFMNRQDL